MKKLLMLLSLIFSLSLGVYAACTDPITGEEHLYEDVEGNLYVLSKAAGPGACAGCGNCVVPL